MVLDALNDVVEAQQRVIALLMKSATNSSRIVAESRGNVAETTTASAGAPRAQTDLDRVIAPLHDAVQKRGLKPMNNRTALTSALADFGLDEIEAAVQRLIQVTAAETVSSPFGLLVSWARWGGPNVRHRTRRLARTGVATGYHRRRRRGGETAARAVKEWEAEPDFYRAELAALDQRIVADNGTVPLLDEVAPMRHAFRVEAFLNTFGRCTDIEAPPDMSASANAYVNPPGHPGQ